MWLKTLSTLFLIILHINLKGQGNQESPYSPIVGEAMKYFNAEKYEQAISYVDSVFETGTPVNKAKLFLVKADSYYFIYDINQSLENYLLSIEYLSEHKLDTTNLISVYSHAGYCFKYMGNFLDAIPYYQKALEISLLAQDTVELANQYYSLGELYMEVGRYKESVDLLNLAYDLDFIRQDTVALAYDLVKLGDLMTKVPDYETAINYYKEGLEVKQSIGDNYSTYTLRLGKLSNAYLLNNDLDSAQIYNQLAIKSALTNNDSLSLAKQWITSSEIFHKAGNTDSALVFGTRAYDFFNINEQSKYVVSAANCLVQSYLAVNRISEADRILSQIIEISSKNQFMEDLANAYLKKADLMEKTGKFNQAIAYFKQHQIIKDTIKNREKQKSISSLNKEYQIKEREQQIELLEARDQVMKLQIDKISQERKVLIGSILLALAIGGYVTYSIWRKNKLKNQLLAAEINELRVKIKGLLEFKPEDVGIVKEQINHSLPDALSDREFEILNKALSNKTNSEIADEVFISVNTVKFHLKNIYIKLGVSNRKEALKYAIQASSS